MLPKDWKIEVVRSQRHTLSISVRPGKVILAKAPLRYPNYQILRFVEEKRDWIEKQFQKLESRENARKEQPPLSMEDIRLLALTAKKVLPERVRYYAKEIGVTYGRITIRNQKSRWGSCSAQGNLNFNCLLMLAPPEVMDYVVIHELCHRLEMNHSAKFWAHVGRYMPDYAQKRKWLKEEGSLLMMRMTGD